MGAIIHILLVDDDEDDYFLTKGLLAERPSTAMDADSVRFHLDWVSSYTAALVEINRQAHDAYIVDYQLGDGNGLQLVQTAVGSGCTAPFILMTGQGNYDLDLEAMRAGVTDYLVKKELTPALLERSIRYSIERKKAAEVNRRDAERSTLLATLSQTLAEAGLDTSDILDTVARQVAMLTGDACIIRLFSEGQAWTELVAIYHPDRRRQAAAERLAISSNFQQIAEAESSCLISGNAVTIYESQNGKTASGNSLQQHALMAPIRAKDRLIGTLSLVRPITPSAYSPEDHVFLLDLANRAALAIENARLYEAVSQRAGELDALHRATAALLSTIDLEILLSRILDIAESAIPAAERACLYLAASETGITQIQGIDAAQEPRIQKIQFSTGPDCSAAILREMMPLSIPELSVVPDLLEHCFPSIRLSENFPSSGSAILAPLILGEELLGLLSLSSSRPAAFTDSDQRLLMSFANTTTAALRNAMLHAKVQKLAITDSLTELYNRRGFFNLGRREVDRAQRFGRTLSAILIDLDNFKDVNDTYGHAVGDQALRIVAERLQSSVREVDILGRYGGDEFVVLLPETDLQAARTAAERIRLHLSEQIALRGVLPEAEDGQGALALTASLGVACLDSQGSPDLLTLLARADAAAYTAKQAGRNRIEAS